MTVIPINERIDAAPIRSRKRISATPWAWRDPATLPRRDWIYGRQLLRGSVSLVIAPGATGKSAMLAGVALALVTGRDFLGKQVWGGPKRVWLWNLEDARLEIERLLCAAMIHWRVRTDDIGERLFVDSGLDGAELKLATKTRAGFELDQAVVDQMAAELIARAVDVLVIDPFVSSHGLDENDNTAIDAVAKQWARIATEANCSIVIVHHSKKLGGEEVSAESARGASALVAAARSVLVLNRMTKDEAESYGIEGEDRRLFFRAIDDKGNRAPPAESSDWFQLVSVSLGNGSEDGPADSMPVVVPWTPPRAFDGVTCDTLRQVQDRIGIGEWRKSDQCAEWAGHAVAEVMGLNAGKASDRRRIQKLLREWISNGALREERRKDGHRETRPFIVVGHRVDDAAPPSGAVRQGAAVRQNGCRAAPPRIYTGGGAAARHTGDERCGTSGAAGGAE